MTYRVFVTAPGLAEEAQAFLQARGCEVRTGEYGDSPEALAARLAEFRPDGLIVRAGRITDLVIDAAPDLRAICKHGVGTDNIDVAAATERGIPVGYTPHANFETLAEHALAMILALLRRLPSYNTRIKRGSFDKKGYDGQALRGKTLGLVGFGRSARRLAELVAPFGVHVLAFHHSGVPGETTDGVLNVRKLDDLLANADIVSLHCPLTDETRHLIDQRSLGLMKPGAYLVNTARGGLVREDDLVQAIVDGRLAGAALDVFEAEPLAADSPLLALEPVLLSPHVGGVSDVSFRTMGMESAQFVLAVLRGEAPPNGMLVS